MERKILFMYLIPRGIESVERTDIQKTIEQLKFRVDAANNIMRETVLEPSQIDKPLVSFQPIDSIDTIADVKELLKTSAPESMGDEDVQALRIILTEINGNDLVSEAYGVIKGWDLQKLNISHLVSIKIAPDTEKSIKWGPASTNYSLFDVEATTTIDGLTNVVLSIMYEISMFYSVAALEDGENFSYRHKLSPIKRDFILNNYDESCVEEIYGNPIENLRQVRYLPMSFYHMNKDVTAGKSTLCPDVFWVSFESDFREVLRKMNGEDTSAPLDK
jgi:hypothetical protein